MANTKECTLYDLVYIKLKCILRQNKSMTEVGMAMLALGRKLRRRSKGLECIIGL